MRGQNAHSTLKLAECVCCVGTPLARGFSKITITRAVGFVVSCASSAMLALDVFVMILRCCVLRHRTSNLFE